MKKQPSSRRVVVLVTRASDHPRAIALIRWGRALLPAAVLVVTPADLAGYDAAEDALVIDADEVPSGPLSLAAALVRAAARPS